MLQITRKAIPILAVGMLLALSVGAQENRDAQKSLADMLLADSMTRGQMAEGMVRALEVAGFQPPNCVPGDEMFDDVPAESLFCPFIEELARRGVTSGCDADNYCPGDPVNRAQMAVFIVKALEAAAPMWAIMSSDASEIPAQSGGISAQRVDGGLGYHVKFPQPVQGKAIVATPLSAGPLGGPTGDVGVKVKPCGDGPVPGDSDCVAGGGDNTPRDVFVFTHDDGSFVEAAFYIVVHP